MPKREVIERELKKELEKGSLTVELSLLLPIVILAIALTIFIALFLYQQVYVTSVANSAVNRGAMFLNNPDMDIETGRVSENELCTYLYSVFAMTYEVEEKIKEYINIMLDEYALLPCMERKIKIEYTNHFVYRRLHITIESRYDMPSFLSARFLGLGDGLVMIAQAEARINEPEQFIRDVDFLRDKINSLQSGDKNYTP
ncbi:MAG: TadE family protein [Alkaliphilus sp.]